MKLRINGNKRVVDIVEEFQHAFPYLNLNFYAPRNGNPVRNSRPKPFPLHAKLKEIQPGVPEGFIDISKVVSVKELERSFAEEFKLNVQVQRKSGNIWLETTVTDSWSLEHQNNHGKEITQNIHPDE